RHLGQDGRPPRAERLREDPRLDARCRGAVRDGARARPMGRTPHWPRDTAHLASSARPHPRPPATRRRAMASVANPTTSESGSRRYRDAELRLWHYYGLEPKERFLDLEAPAGRLRVLEVGSGEPILFVHGTAGPGSW